MEELEQRLLALAENVRSTLKLEYNEESVKYQEGYIERTKSQIEEDYQEGFINAMGAFLGQCIIVIYGGAWYQDEDMGVCIRFDEHNKLFPFSKVGKQFENGLEDSVYSFFTVIPHIFKLGGRDV